MTEQPQPTTAAPETITQLEEAASETDAPLVGIIMGSQSDMDTMAGAAKVLEDAGIRSETRVMSAHRDPETVADYCKNARMRGLKVIIAGAGLSAALPGVAAAHTDLPVIGVPLSSRLSRRRRARRASSRSSRCRRASGRRRRPGQREERGHLRSLRGWQAIAL